jgi:hypothetical protein
MNPLFDCDPPNDPDIYWLVAGDDGYEDFVRPNELPDFLALCFKTCSVVTAALVFEE